MQGNASMKGFEVWMLFGASLGLAAPGVMGAPKVQPATFEAEYVVRTSSYGLLQKAKLTTKGNMLRYQQRTGGGLKLLFLRNHGGTYHINLHTNDGARWPAAWAKNFENRLFTGGPQGDPWVFLKAAHARRTGRETVNGRTAEIWTYRLPSTTGQDQVCRLAMDVKQRRPLQVEIRTQVMPGKADRVIVEYQSYRWNFPLPDSYFDLPRGARLVDLGHPNAPPFTAGPGRQGAGKRASAGVQ
jgi:hypothetical protein